MRRHERVVLVALLGCVWCLLYPAWAAPVIETRPTDAHAIGGADGSSSQTSWQPAFGQRGGATAEAAGGSGGSSSVGVSGGVGGTLEAMQTHGYFCGMPGGSGKRSCNTCHFLPREIHPADPKPHSNGDSSQSRIEGTNVTKAELADKGIRYLQVGGDWWNKCGDGWLNSDFVYTRLPVGFVCEDWRTGRYILRQDAGHRWPFEDGSFDIVYSEHMFEHILPMDGSTFLREMYRILRPGGVLRVTTPDLEKYLSGYVHRKTDPFLQEHAARFPPMGKLGPPFTAATVVNNIFRNYEHRWIYDYEEFEAVAVHAGIPRAAVIHSRRMGPELSESFREAVRLAETVSTARKQHGMKENPTRCWLEQEVREPETLYVTIVKQP